MASTGAPRHDDVSEIRLIRSVDGELSARHVEMKAPIIDAQIESCRGRLVGRECEHVHRVAMLSLLRDYENEGPA